MICCNFRMTKYLNSIPKYTKYGKQHNNNKAE